MTSSLKKIKNKVSDIVRTPAKKSDNPIKWGIIGTGYMAETFSRAIDGNQDGVVFAVASRNEEKAGAFSKRHGGCRFYGSYTEIVKDSDIDIIYIATPTKYHFEHIKLCLSSGKNVLCEKPITTDAPQLEELICLARRQGCFLMEGMWMKCLPTYQKAKDWLKDGKIGTLKLARVDFYKHEIIDPKRAIFNKDEGGGVLGDYGIYALAFPSGFMNCIPDVISAESVMSSFQIDSDWNICLKYEDKKAFINISSDFDSLSKAALIGENGTIEWASQFNRTNAISLFDRNGNKIETFEERYVFEGFEFEVNEVQRVLKSGLRESSVCTLEESLLTMKLYDQLRSRIG